MDTLIAEGIGKSYKGRQVVRGVDLRISRGEAITAADYIDILQARNSMIARAAVRLAPYDAVVMPTWAMIFSALTARRPCA